MIYIFLFLLVCAYAIAILGIKTQLFAKKYPDSFYPRAALGYGKKFIAIVPVTIFFPLFVSSFPWWVEIFLIIGLVPAGSIFGSMLARAEHRYRVTLQEREEESVMGVYKRLDEIKKIQNTDSEVLKGNSVKAMADHYRNKQNGSHD